MLPRLSRYRNELLTRDNAWTVFTVLCVIAATKICRHLLKSGWEKTTGLTAPLKPDADDSTWVRSMSWGLLTGALIGVVRALSRQGAGRFQKRFS